MKRPLDPDASSAVGMNDGSVGHAVRKVVAQGEAEGVGQCDTVREERIVGRVNRRVILHFVGILAGGIIQIEIMDGTLVSVIERKAFQIARKDFQPSARRSCAVGTVHVDIEVARAVQKAVAAVVVVVEIIPNAQCIGRNAGIYLAVAQDRDVEPVVDVRPDIEIRGVVTAQINVVGQHFRSPHSTDQKIRGIRGGIVRILLTLVGNGRHRSLHIGQQITVACSQLS